MPGSMFVGRVSRRHAFRVIPFPPQVLVSHRRRDGVDDRRSVAARVGRELELDRVHAELSPEEKLAVVRCMREGIDRAVIVNALRARRG